VHICTNFGQSLLPLLVVLLSRNRLFPTLASLPTHEAHDDDAKEPHVSSDTTPHYRPFYILFVATVSAIVVLAVYSVPATSALGISSTIFTAIGLVLLETTARSTEDEDTQGAYSATSADGTNAIRSPPNALSRVQQLAALRDVAAALTTACGVAALFLESSINSAAPSHASSPYGPGWKTVHKSIMLLRLFWLIPVNVLIDALMYMIVSVF
jgi:hypothetical protein